jgi:hypothetical protein
VGERNLPTAREEALVVAEAIAVAGEESTVPAGEGLAAPIASTVVVEKAVLVQRLRSYLLLCKRKCPQLR